MIKTFSIIIPHRDIPLLLEKCLKSIPQREDIEIIVIDDCSSIDNIKVLQELTIPNVVITYTTEGKGAGFARNIGLSKATGKWVLFADADDYFAKDAFLGFDSYVDSSYDIIYFDQEGRVLNTNQYSNRCQLYSQMISDFLKDRNLKHEERIRYEMHTPYVKMINRDLILQNNILFDECTASNDVMFSAYCGYYAKSIFVDHHIAYYVSIRTGSLTKIRSKENAFSRYCVWLRYNKFVVQIKNPHLQVLLLSRIIQALLFFGWNEFISYIKEANRVNINIFSKWYLIFGSIKSYAVSLIIRDKFLIKK